MGTITRRPRKDGTTSYTAQVRLTRGGKLLYSQAATFDRERAAKAWLARKEKELAEPGALEAARAAKSAVTVGGLIDLYLGASRRAVGRTKAQVLEALKAEEIAELEAPAVTSADLVDLARRLGSTRQPQTVQNYLSHLSAVFAVARSAFKVEVDRNAFADAMEACKRLGLTAKSAERDRRPTLDELDQLMGHFVDRTRRRGALPMHRVVAFAIFSTRRQEEITRIRRADLQGHSGDHPARILVRDMKHPGEKAGNDVWCHLVPEAEAIARAMPEQGDCLFPYTTDAISAAFTRACQLLGIEDLHFHDLRHEGVSRLFEMGWTIPRVAEVSGHRSWQSLQRYAHLRQTGDRFAGWAWLDVVRDAAPKTSPAR